MWKLRVYQTDRLEEGLVGEKLRDQDFGWINFTRKLGNEDLSFHHFPFFSCCKKNGRWKKNTQDVLQRFLLVL